MIQEETVATFDGTHSLSNLYGCLISCEKCKNNDGIILWDTKEARKHCPYQKQKEYRAFVFKKHVVVEGFQVFTDNGGIKGIAESRRGTERSAVMENDINTEIDPVKRSTRSNLNSSRPLNNTGAHERTSPTN